MFKKLLVSLPIFVASSYVSADVQYKLDVIEPNHHLAQVNVALPRATGKFIDVKLPAWRTGRYEILDLANGIRFFNPTDKTGNALKWEKTEKSTWRVYLDRATNVQLDYQVYANQLGTRSRHIDDTHAYIDASGYFMYAEQFRDEAVSVELTVPKGWASHSGMNSGEKPHSYIADDFDVLIDSPIETGVNSHHEFKFEGKEYEVVFWGKGNYDEKKTVDDIKKLVAQYGAIWPSVPFERYVFMVHATTNARGATEHLNSTIIQRKRFSFAPRDNYLAFLSTASHEFVHTWNVKAYRPAGLVPYDYVTPNYSELLWISEGSTSYFQDQLLLRAGIMKPKEFFKKLAKRIERHQHTPGRFSQTIAQASFDSWINMRGDHAKNFSTNIYSEGFLASWLLDLQILKDTNLKASYRDVHSELYEHYKIPHGFTKEDVLTSIENVAGKSYQSWWDKNVESTLMLDFDEMLNQVGLEATYPEKAKDIGFSGFTTKDVKGHATISSVEKGSPAWEAGLTTDDIIVALDGLRVVGGKVKTRMKDFKEGDQIRVDFFRNDALHAKVITLGKGKDKPLTVKVLDEPTDAQKANFEAWLGIALPVKK